MNGKARVLLIVNPMATGVKKRKRAAVEQALLGHDITVTETEGRDHATELARKAAADGMDAVFVLGGDGTVNEAANGLIDTDTALGALPGGSTNVFSRTIGLSRKAGRAAAQLTEALNQGSVREMGVGVANGRYFLFHVGIGYDAAVVERVEHHSNAKRKLGQAVFVYDAFATWFRHYDHRHPSFSVSFPDRTRVDDGYFAICLNTNPYTYFGIRPLNVAPGADGESGLTMVTLRSLKVRHIVGVFRRALGSGKKVATYKKVHQAEGLQSLVVEAAQPVPFQADGDSLGRAQRIEIAHERAKLQVVVPLAR
jgi:diacylglycerol kinase family enzyme